MPTHQNVSTALPVLLQQVLTDGLQQGSRNGAMRELTMVQVTLRQPWQRYITTPGRRASLPAQIAETMWLLAGRNDIGWLSNYLPRAAEFSDDGATWRGAYGPRIRRWQPVAESGRPWSHDQKVDQLAHVVKLLQDDPDTRRAVIAIYDPAIDTQPGKDIPCNNWIHLLHRDGELHGHVAIRSNDLMWGWSGINAFEWSALLEIVAGLVGMRVGKLTFSISSLHLYDHHHDKGWRIIGEHDKNPHANFRSAPRFNADGRTLAEFDQLVNQWFRIERMIREEPRGSAWRHITLFPEPMLRSWLMALYSWWNGDLGVFARNVSTAELCGTDLEAALHASPRREGATEQQAEQRPVSHHDSVSEALSAAWRQVMDTVPKLQTVLPPVQQTATERVQGKLDEQAFRNFVVQLHNEKDAAYGDSWKRRGEQIAILANIARKVDRLGVAGGGDTAADTVIDLLVYLVKYRLWIAEFMDAPLPEALHDWAPDLSDNPEHVAKMIYRLRLDDTDRRATDEQLVHRLRTRFDALEKIVASTSFTLPQRHTIVNEMLPNAFLLAYRLWSAEQAEQLADPEHGMPAEVLQVITPTHAERNATRFWKGYDA